MYWVYYAIAAEGFKQVSQVLQCTVDDVQESHESFSKWDTLTDSLGDYRKDSKWR